MRKPGLPRERLTYQLFLYSASTNPLVTQVASIGAQSPHQAADPNPGEDEGNIGWALYLWIVLVLIYIQYARMGYPPQAPSATRGKCHHITSREARRSRYEFRATPDPTSSRVQWNQNTGNQLSEELRRYDWENSVEVPHPSVWCDHGAILRHRM